jgi:hypothetical protein
MENANELKTGIEATGYTWGRDKWFSLWLSGRKVGAIVGYSRALSQLQGIARNKGVDLRAARAAYVAALEVEAAHNAPQHAATCAPATMTRTAANTPGIKPSAPRCSFYKSIRRAYAIAKDAGLDTRADDAMRAAFAAFLGRSVPTRETLNARDWLLVGDAIKSRRLAW